MRRNQVVPDGLPTNGDQRPLELLQPSHHEQCDAPPQCQTKEKLSRLYRRGSQETFKCGVKGGCWCSWEDFLQQQMITWEPVLTPRGILLLLLICGIFFLVVGGLAYAADQRIVECKVDYTHLQGEGFIKVDASSCSDSSASELSGDVYLLYELSNFFQNHRSYMKSKNDAQLKGKVYTSPADVSSCSPRTTSPDGRVLHPCGSAAWGVFTDGFSVFKEDMTTHIELDESRDTICFSGDLDLYKNPTESEVIAAEESVFFWLREEWITKALHMEKPGVGTGVENSHFIVWMRDATLPTFRKMYAKLPSPVQLPFYVKVEQNTFDVATFGGSKAVVVTEASWVGLGKSYVLVVSYLTVGSLCILIFLILLFYHTRNPRHLGDVSWLRKALYPN